MKQLNTLKLNRDDIEYSLRVTAARQSQRRLERRLAESLAAATSLASGSALVMWLGDGQENSNLDALTTWVGRTLQQLGLDANRQAIPRLLAELERTLWAWEDQAWQ
ncbi:hypothetical protein [Halomonas sp. KRD171]|jgi:hypothetical protein|uniref:hypothetical protein n=1 Tax=Halomonas sp. KRD171 TaxID=2729726 RepID=UPI0019D14520|nr:hypothetical protein [Halomonas sp. KRD171]